MFKKYFEDTVSADIAQGSSKLGKLQKKKLKDGKDGKDGNVGIDEMKGYLRSELESALQTIGQNCKSKEMFEAIDKVLTLMDDY